MRPRPAGARTLPPATVYERRLSMFENRQLRRDLCALGLLACVLFLAVSLLTYNPADPLGRLIAPLDRLYEFDVLVDPPGERITNAFRWWGAFAADVLLNALGVAAYVLVIALSVLAVHLLRRKEIESPLTRFFGWAMTLAGCSSLAALASPALSPGPVIGAGGCLGAMMAALLHTHFAQTGGVILSLSMILGGLLLCTDYALLRAAALAGRGVRRGLSKGRQMARRRGLRSSDVEHLDDDQLQAEHGGEDVEEDEEEYDEEEYDEEPRIRIRGHKAADEDDEQDEWEEEEEDDEAEDEAEDEWDEEEDEVVVKTPVRSRTDPAHEKGQAPRSRAPRKRTERDAIIEELNRSQFDDEEEYELPDLDLLIPPSNVCYESQRKELNHKRRVLEQTFRNFGFNVKVVEIETGPVIAQYEIELEAGLRLSKITNLADDLAIALRVPSVRIVAPIPGKNTVGIEVPNSSRQIVRLREVIEETNGKMQKMRIPLFLGKDVSGNPLTVDLSTLPHLLIAGRTGTGKSVCLNAIISSILMTKRPDEVRLLLIDPKMVELSGYGRLPHLMHPVVTDMRKAEAILAWAVDKMEERYSLLARAGVRHISSYNQLGEEELLERLQPESDEEREGIPLQMPFIVIVADEMADLMMTAGKEVEQHIIRLAQKSRAVGIHLILATQKPTVDVITGLIKSNLPARISFQVASRTDSRVVLDEMGADRLLGNGDMLFLWPGTSMLLRGQGTYLSDDEIDRVTDSVSTGEQNFVNELVNMQVDAPNSDQMEQMRKRDDLYESAIDVVVREQRGSVSLLQRALGIGYGRGARLIDFMAEDGIVGSYAGSQAREVLISVEDWERMQGLEGAGGDDGAAAAATAAATAAAKSLPAAEAKRPRITAATAAASKTPPQRRNRFRPDPDPPEEAPPWDEDADSASADSVSADSDSSDSGPKIVGLPRDDASDQPAKRPALAVDVEDEQHQDIDLDDETEADEDEAEYDADEAATEDEDDEYEDDEYEDDEYEDDSEEEYEEDELDEEAAEYDDADADDEAEEEYEEAEYEDEEYADDEYEYEYEYEDEDEDGDAEENEEEPDEELADDEAEDYDEQAYEDEYEYEDADDDSDRYEAESA